MNVYFVAPRCYPVNTSPHQHLSLLQYFIDKFLLLLQEFVLTMIIFLLSIMLFLFADHIPFSASI
jgi:hypothetical protein